MMDLDDFAHIVAIGGLAMITLTGSLFFLVIGIKLWFGS